MDKVRGFVAGAILLGGLVTAEASAQSADHDAVAAVVEAFARSAQAKDISGLDTLFAHDAWVRIIEGAGVNQGWAEYRDDHLRPELQEFREFEYRYSAIAPQVRGSVAWTPFRFDLAAVTSRGRLEAEGRGTAILEKREGRWLIVHLHTSGQATAEPQ